MRLTGIESVDWVCQHNLSERTLIWAEYVGRKADDNRFYGDQNAIAIGTQVDF